MAYAVHFDPSALSAALSVARGRYQRAVLRGTESLSGATLTGRAAQYSGRYAESRRHLLARLTAAGITWSIVSAPELRREYRAQLVMAGQPIPAADERRSYLVIGTPPVAEVVALEALAPVAEEIRLAA